VPEKKAEARIRAKSKTLSQKVDSDSNQLPILIRYILILTLKKMKNLGTRP